MFSGICPKKRDFLDISSQCVRWANMSSRANNPAVGRDGDISTPWTYLENVSKKTHLLDISLFLPPEEVQKLRVQKNTLPTRLN
jgi:hypothetical protein